MAWLLSGMGFLLCAGCGGSEANSRAADVSADCAKAGCEADMSALDGLGRTNDTSPASDVQMDVSTDTLPSDLTDWTEAAFDREVTEPLETPILQFDSSLALGLSLGVRVGTNVPTTLEVVLENQATGTKAAFSTLPGYSTAHVATIVMMRPATLYRVRVKVTDASGAVAEAMANWSTTPLPQDFPVVVVRTDNPDLMAPGLTLVSAYNPYTMKGLYFLLDSAGEVVFYNLSALGFVVPLPSGSFLGNLGPVFPLCEYTLLGSALWCTSGADFGVTKFHHQQGVTPEGNYLGLGLEMKPVSDCPDSPGTMNTVGDVVVEMSPTGELVRQFSLLDLIGHDRLCDQLSLTSGTWDMEFPAYAPTKDRTHANSVFVDPSDGNLMVSMHNLHLVAKMDRFTGQILWTLGANGDFALAPGGRWSFDHHFAIPEPDGRLMLYDNRPLSPPNEARAVEYHYQMPTPDKATWVAEQVWEYSPKPPVDSTLAGSLGEVHRLENGNVLIVDGRIDSKASKNGYDRDPTNHPKGRISEVTYPSSTEVFQVEVQPPSGMVFGYWVVGSRRLTSLGEPPP